MKPDVWPCASCQHTNPSIVSYCCVKEAVKSENETLNIPTYAKEVFDVTGAGDTVISVYTLACATGIDGLDAAKIANTAAGVVVGKRGTSTVTSNEIIEFYNRIYGSEIC